MAQNESVFSSIFGSALGSAAGNAAGAGIGYLINEAAAENQLKRQKELVHFANSLNEQNVSNQAALEVQGLKNAGLNPAMADGSGAPQVSGGQASANSVPTLGNIFDGIAQIITAAKAPSEISRTESETSRTQAETSRTQADTSRVKSETSLNAQKLNLVTPQLMKKTGAEIDSLVQSIRGAKNANDTFEAADKFLRYHSAVIFESALNKLQKDGLFDALSEDTQNTLVALANGQIQLGQGEIDALRKSIDAQVALSDADKALVHNAFDNAVVAKQFADKKVFESIYKAPQAVRDYTYKQMKKLEKDMEHINQLINTEKAQAALDYANKAMIEFERESKELNDVKWLIKHGRYDDADVRTWEQTLDEVSSIAHEVIRTGASIGTGYAAGRGAAAGKAASGSAPILRHATEKEIMDVNRPKSFGNTLFYAR